MGFLTNKGLARRWATSYSAPALRIKNGSMRANGRILLSYCTAIAQFVDLPDGRMGVVLNRCRYSNTTDRHQSHVRSSVQSQGHPTVDILDVNRGDEYLVPDDPIERAAWLDKQLRCFSGVATGRELLARRCRLDRTREWCLAQARGARENMERLKRWFGLSFGNEEE